MDDRINLNRVKNSVGKTSGRTYVDSGHTSALSPTEIKVAPFVSEDSNRTVGASYDQSCLQTVKSTKSRILAAVLAIFLGGIGIHNFYCGKIGKGILCILFCWTYIPSIIAFIEGIIYLTESDEVFNAKHVG